MSLRRSSILLATLLAASALGCTASKIDDGSTSEGGEQRSYPLTDEGIEESLRDHMTEVGDDLNLWVPRDDEAACAARRLVDRFGADRLIALGYDPEVGRLSLGYEAADRSATVNILSGCIDFSRGLLEMMTAYSKTPLAGAECVTRGIETAGLSRRFAESLVDGAEPDVFAGDAELGRGVAELLGKCMEVGDLDPLLPLPKYPGAFGSASTTTPGDATAGTTTTVDPGADGIIPAGGG